jgi:hypothetical protein
VWNERGRPEKNRRSTMNVHRYEPHARTRPTQTFWPGTRRPEPSSAQPRTADAPREEKKEDDHSAEEPGYGHGV